MRLPSVWLWDFTISALPKLWYQTFIIFFLFLSYWRSSNLINAPRTIYLKLWREKKIDFCLTERKKRGSSSGACRRGRGGGNVPSPQPLRPCSTFSLQEILSLLWTIIASKEALHRKYDIIRTFLFFGRIAAYDISMDLYMNLCIYLIYFVVFRFPEQK